MKKYIITLLFCTLFCHLGIAQGLKSVSILGDSYSTFEGYVQPEDVYKRQDQRREIFQALPFHAGVYDGEVADIITSLQHSSFLQMQVCFGFEEQRSA